MARLLVLWEGEAPCIWRLRGAPKQLNTHGISCTVHVSGQTKQSLNAPGQDEELERLHELFASVGTLSHPQQDISAAQWLKNQVMSYPQIMIASTAW